MTDVFCNDLRFIFVHLREQSHKIGTTHISCMKKLRLGEFGRFSHDHQASK